MRKFIPGFYLFMLLLVAGILQLPGGNVLAANPDNNGKTAVKTNPAQSHAGAGQILTRLPNGLLVYVIRDTRFPLSCTRLYVRAGSANEKQDQAGISHVLEHMVFKGTSHRPKGKVARDVEALGGYLNAFTSFDETCYLTDMPAAHWKMGMDVVKDMAFQATLDQEELEAEKRVVISELQRGDDSPLRKLYENLQVAALRNTPYGRPIIGFEKTIRDLSAKDLREYVRQWYQPQNMMLLVAGDMDPDKVLEHAQNLFGKLTNISDLAMPKPLNLENAANGSEKVGIERGPWNKVYLGIALPVPGYRDLRSIELDVLSYLLGGDGTSAFYKKFKYELQLVDSIDVSNMSMSRAGLLTIIAQLDAGKVDEFWKELTSDLGRLSARAFSPEAIARAKFNLEDSMDRAGETLNGLASWKGNVQFNYGGEQGEKNIRFTQNNVNEDQLQNAITNWLDSRQARVRVLAPENAELPDFAAIMETNWPRVIAPENAPANAGANSALEEISLENNCKLVLLPDASTPYVSFVFMLPGGNALLKPDQQGLANLTARMLTDGCGSLNNPAMERWFAERAASVSANAGQQSFTVSLTGPSRFNMDYFDIFRDILRRPRFEATELAREIGNMKASIKRRNDQPLSYIFSKLNPFLFPNEQPWGYDPLGNEKLLDAYNVMNVRDFWTKQISQPWVLAIAGDFRKEQVLEFVKSLPVPHADKLTFTPPVWEKDKKNLNLVLPGRNQAHLLQIFKTVPIADPDTPALMLAQAVLSGQSGLLFSKLRDDEGLGYTVTAFNRSSPEWGFMAFYIGTTANELDKSRKGFADVIAGLKETPLAQEVLKAGANKLMGDYLRDRQSLSSRATEASTNVIFGFPQDFQKELLDKAAKLTPADIQETAKKYLVTPYNITLKP